MNFAFHEEAETEFWEAIEHYELAEPGLGEEFSLEIFATINRVTAHSETWPLLEGDVRRSLANRFPFGVIYSIEPERIFILAVMHLHRDPDYWKERK